MTSQSRTHVQPHTITRIGSLQIAIIVLAVVTGLIHLNRAIVFSQFASHAGSGHVGLRQLISQNIPLLFFLDFLGYIVLVAALYLPMFRRYQRLIRWLLIALTAITIVAYFALLGFRSVSFGYLDKAIELLLLILLLVEVWKAHNITTNAQEAHG